MPSFLTNMDQQVDISSEPVSFKCTVNRCEVSKVLWRQLVYFVKSEHIYLQSPNYWENFVSFGEATIENFREMQQTRKYEFSWVWGKTRNS